MCNRHQVIFLDQDFTSQIQSRARQRRAKIGIGIQNPDENAIQGLKAASEYADLVMVGDVSPSCGLTCIESDQPWVVLAELLYTGEIEGAVRGNISASKAMKSISRQFHINVRRMALLEIRGWSFFLSPVGIDEGETIPDQLGLVLDGAKYLERMGISPKISVLSGGRMEDLGRSARVDRSLADAEFVAARARVLGLNAKHRGILIESCKGDDFVLAPDGISGNLIFRTLHLLCGANALGAPVLMDEVFVDSSRARGDFVGPVALASALVSLRDT
jgi:putative methanogen marker protein 4